MPNPLYGVPRYGADALARMLHVSDFQSKGGAFPRLRVFWVTGQDKAWFNRNGNPAPLNNFYQPYLAPSGWPIANHVLGLPKVVRFVQATISSVPAPNARGLIWDSVGSTLQANMLAKHPQVMFLLPWPKGGKNARYQQWLQTITPADYSYPASTVPPLGTVRVPNPPYEPVLADFQHPFLGVDVYNVVITQDLDTLLGNNTGCYYSTIPGDQPDPVFISDTAFIPTVFPQFRRMATQVYLDAGFIQAENFGTANWNTLITAMETWLQNMVTNSGVYGTLGLKNQGFNYAGRLDVNSGVTALAALLQKDIEKHFGL